MNLGLHATSEGFFGLEEIPFLKDVKLGSHALWEYAAIAIYLVLAVIACGIVRSAFLRQSAKLQKRKAARWLIQLTDLTRRPMVVIVFLWIANEAVRSVSWSHRTEILLGQLYVLAVALVATFAVFAGIEMIAEHARQILKPREQASHVPVIALAANVAKVFAVIIVIVTTTQNLGIQVGGLITTLGIGSAAIALAAQETLSNFFGCLALFADPPFHVGDEIKVELHQGIVEKIGLRSTKLRTGDGIWITIPNRILANVAIQNFSRKPQSQAETDYPSA